MAKFMEEEERKAPYSHCYGNLTLESNCELSIPVQVRSLFEYDQHELAVVIGQFIAYHAVHIRPELNGFPGYDCVKYDFTRTPELRRRS